MLCNLIEPATGTNIDLTATSVSIHGRLIDNSSALLKYDVDLIKSNCINITKKCKPKKFKRKDRNDNGAIHLRWIAEDVQKTLPKDLSNHPFCAIQPWQNPRIARTHTLVSNGWRRPWVCAAVSGCGASSPPPMAKFRIASARTLAHGFVPQSPDAARALRRL